MPSLVWNPQLYNKFSNHRLQPAKDLICNAIRFSNRNGTDFRRVLDLGCGPGNVTSMLSDEYIPNAKIDAFDSSPEMINTAKSQYSNHKSINFNLSTIEDVVSKIPEEGKYDLVYSNAAFHFLPNHKRQNILCNLVNKDSIVAIQMPDTKKQKSHTLMIKAAENLNIKEIKASKIARKKLSNEWYYKTLKPLVSAIEMFSTEYTYILPYSKVDKLHPVHSFTSGTGLMLLIDKLNEIGSNDALIESYRLEYDRLLREEYPVYDIKNDKDYDGSVLCDYRRFFLLLKV
jgi:trans-aconitate 2-methyltransferase